MNQTFNGRPLSGPIILAKVIKTELMASKMPVSSRNVMMFCADKKQAE
jgi:hypothetical protein